MALRSSGRKLSFDILNTTPSGSSSLFEEEDENLLLLRSSSDPAHDYNVDTESNKRKRKKKNNKKKKNKKKGCNNSVSVSSIEEEDPITMRDENNDLNVHRYTVQSVVYQEVESGGSVCNNEPVGYVIGELRQRSVNGGIISGGEGSASSQVVDEEEEKGEEEEEVRKRLLESNGIGGVTKLETAESLDWKRLMAEDPNYLFSVEKSPVKYFIDDMFSGNSLRTTTTLANEKERERVYDTIFRLPWRCELLIDVGVFVCFDSFLALLTIMPTRILMALWRLLNTRQFKIPSAAELSDFGCFVVMACGVALLGQIDISLIYHMIRGQGTIKLYVVYNVLEIFDKLCQNFIGDVLQTLFSSAEGLASSPPEKMTFSMWRYISDLVLAVAASIVHSFVLLAQAITLSTCIVAHNNALMALLVSNNFAEIKSNVFKRFSKDNIHSLVYFDSIERFHISAFVLFVLAQNILEAEGPWFESFLFNAFLVYICEVIIDIIKHSFIAKFNDIKPIAYSEFLEDLCKQTLNIQTENKHNLTFIPLAPACVVIRVLTPVYAAHLPCDPLPWRLLWVFLLLAMTYIMLASLKVLVGMGLQKHATWYVNRCRQRKHHLHTD